MDDLIKRRDAIATARKMYDLWNEAYIDRVMLFTDEYRDMVVESLMVLPSAGRKKGKWVEIPQEPFAPIYECSECGHEPAVEYDGWLLSDYCPYCGAEMIKETDGRTGFED